MKTEVEKSGGYGWITAGKEVEDYIPKSAWQRLCDNPKLRGPSKFTNAIAYFKKHKKRKTARKVEIAQEIVPLLDRASIAATLDMPKHLDVICKLIREWNGESPEQ